MSELHKLAERMSEYDTLADFLKFIDTEYIRFPPDSQWDEIILRYLGLDHEKIQEERLAWKESCNSN